MPASRYLDSSGTQSEFGFAHFAGLGGALSGFNGLDPNPQYFASTEDRGGLRPNGRVSLGTSEAGAHLTRGNLHWDGAGAVGQAVTVTFAFRSTAPDSIPNGYGGFSRFTDAQIAATLLALSAWSDVANITFQRVSGAAGEEAYTNNASMLFGNFSNVPQEVYAFGASPGSRDSASGAGDVWTNSARGVMANPVVLENGQRYLTFAIGQALGLQRAETAYFEDSQQYSVMSAFTEGATGGIYGARYSAAPMLDDIAAIQRLYGANMTTRTGDTVYGFNSTASQPWFSARSSTSPLIFAVWDAGGVDTLDFSGYAVEQTIDLRQTSFSSVGGLTGNVAIALGAAIENAVGGSGNDRITGNSGDNVLTGNAGQDTIDGGLGTDTAVFRFPRSEYTITVEGQMVLVSHPTEGTDALRNIEFLRFSDQTIPTVTLGGLMVTGDILNNLMDGTGFDDTLSGLGGNDTLTGLGGNDSLNGGSGNDTIAGGNGDDIVTGGLGNDTLDGGTGSDVADYSGASGSVQVSLVTGLATGAEGSDTLTGFEHIRGGAFNDVLIGDDQANRIEGNGGVDILRGGGGNDILITAAPTTNPLGATLDGGDGNDSLRGGAGIDTLIGGAGSDLIDGDFGVDAALYSGVRRQYGVSAASGPVTPFVTRSTVSGGPEGGTDTLVDVEQCRFVDGVMSFDVNGIPAQVMRLYDTILDRQPDQAGLDVQVRALASGSTTLLALASAFTASPEFVDRYGTLSNEQFVGQLYRFALDRDATAAEITFQAAALNTGTSRAQLLVNFSESGEHRVQTQSVLNAGLWVPDEKALQIARLYDATFDRLPDAAGLAGQLAALNAGTSLLTLAANFAASPEFQARYGALSNQAFVEQLYRFCLDREGDAAGIAVQVNALNTGTSRAALLLAFSESPEHVALTAPLWSGGIRTIDAAFSGAVEESAGQKALDGQPLVLVAEDDTGIDGTPFEGKTGMDPDPQVQPGPAGEDPADVVIAFKIDDDAFVLPAQDALEPLVLPDVEGGLPMPFGGFASPTDDWMVTLPVNNDGALSDPFPWHRTAGEDGWMLH
ncbi:DUF4214 domain-containing protein [Brevundimonas variabilis]|uniref:Ca2+-binding RTX toxin-like protein n=1 Tax=Brevundimonas variabilis TaxID=74312 RepID=A0A7W9FFC7_9CAUL|nr:M10 family metallopeptidase C-terminal domain-containing protein [Brevundimonas variabilis]MBB5747282.1 Ca2+-binding RTX toxin-like protein [Brevundimonas variabilis]